MTNLVPEQAHDLLRHARRPPLESIFAPRTVAVIGATEKEGSVGRAVLERQVLVEARRGPMRIVGPNCLGVMSPHAPLNATFAATILPDNRERQQVCRRVGFQIRHEVGDAE